MSQAERVRSYYDANTEPFYLQRWHPEDIHFGLFEPRQPELDYFPAVKRMTRAILAPASIRASDLVVDAGCGVGGAAVDIACTTQARVLGLTISPVQVELARKRADRAGVGDRARFARADCAGQLPCADASVDVVVTIEAACHFADKSRFLSECRRVLKPGGRLVGSDWIAADDVSDAEYARHLQPVCDAWHLARLDSPNAWRSLLAGAGFEVKTCVDLGEAVLENAQLVAHGRHDLMLEVANGCHSPEMARAWQDQYDTLYAAWVARRFSIGTFFARVPLVGQDA